MELLAPRWRCASVSGTEPWSSNNYEFPGKEDKRLTENLFIIIILSVRLCHDKLKERLSHFKTDSSLLCPSLSNGSWFSCTWAEVSLPGDGESCFTPEWDRVRPANITRWINEVIPCGPLPSEESWAVRMEPGSNNIQFIIGSVSVNPSIIYGIRRRELGEDKCMYIRVFNIRSLFITSCA